MKKIITSIIFCILLFSLLISITACATDISKIQPDYPSVIVPNGQTSNSQANIIYRDKDTIVIIPISTIPPIVTETYQEVKEEKEETTTVEEETPVVKEKEQLINDIFVLINAQRLENHLHALLYNDDLQATADIRAKEASQKFSHTRPDGTDCYTAFPDFMNTAGENLLMSDNEIATAENIVNTWMNSQGHKDNILAERYTDTAIGIYITETTTFIAQIFIG